MSRPLVVRPEAESDVAAAVQWYEGQRPGLSLAFRSALDRAFSTIIENPDRYARIYRDVRRALVRRFPYGVFYIEQGERIVVVGVLHTSRNPTLWRSRSK